MPLGFPNIIWRRVREKENRNSSYVRKCFVGCVGDVLPVDFYFIMDKDSSEYDNG